MVALANPFAFRPAQVTFWLALIYAALVIPSVFVHESVPAPPSPDDLDALSGMNITEAWLDLLKITEQYHPYASHANDDVRNYIMKQVEDILNRNNASFGLEKLGDQAGLYSPSRKSVSNASVVVFSDMLSNVTTGTVVRNVPGFCAMGHYFEGSNIYVYIRGTEDDPNQWWHEEHVPGKRYGGNGVLVNAHYDSVSTGFGATDDGMGVVSVLQVINHYTKPGNQPKNGLVAMFNNGEEDYLWGARAFGKSPLMPFIHTFLNLEGAGGGGRAVLFRTSDAQVTKPYARSQHPFGTVIGDEGFRSGAIQSQTDYIVLDGVYGQRGLDLAFYKPRARYHTNQDDVRHASTASLWHMLSASVATLDGLTSDTSKTFTGPRSDNREDLVQNGRGKDGVWFDIFGSAFVLFERQGLFAWSATLLVTGPVVLFLITIILVRLDKYYLFTSVVRVRDVDEIYSIQIDGFHGFFRTPIALAVSTLLISSTALLVNRINPLVSYGNEYTVWAMMFSLALFSLWLIARSASSMRPTAFQRAYTLMWLYIFGWVVLLGLSIAESQWRIVSGYSLVVMHSTIYIAFIIALLELFSLPSKEKYALRVHEMQRAIDDLNAGESEESALISPTPGEIDSRSMASEFPEQPAGEETPLLGGGGTATNNLRSFRTTFASGYRRSVFAAIRTHRESHAEVYGGEQDWSTDLHSWTWLLQAFILGPINLMLLVPTGLFLMSSMNQTGADGSNTLIPYVFAGFFSLLACIPALPFLHRVPSRLPLVLLIVFVITLVYNLFAFPFSAQARYKSYFQQSINLDTGVSTVRLDGLEDYIRPIIASIPASAGVPVVCDDKDSRAGLVGCKFNTTDKLSTIPSPVPGYEGMTKDFIAINVTRVASGARKASLSINGMNTKACFVRFNAPIKKFGVASSGPWDERFSPVPEEVCQVKLWRRDWQKSWTLDVEWTAEAEAEAKTEVSATGSKGRIGGEVVCIWSDANVRGNIPVLDQLLAFAPEWAAITKRAEGLVEGTRSFTL
ncbi:Vacuolar membrane protease [Ceratocystis fimbriata CBS 114723]|uniref:Peptide hydrolase n=1 Tax=Ceratocystis fimbriata CBS 114723 TaxID=1035309 RepID=A0A2C5WWN5_9PEZI|nr:Vacuolar membrane protease [Ceratocystis fimbriata CBS 114723]